MFLQRLFSTFPNGWPGRGLLLQRFVTAIALFFYSLGHFREACWFAVVCPHVIAAATGMFLLVGLWTPFCRTLIALIEVWLAFNGGDLWTSIMLGTLGASLAMIGPGAWSIDARLFGRRHFEIPKP